MPRKKGNYGRHGSLQIIPLAEKGMFRCGGCENNIFATRAELEQHQAKVHGVKFINAQTAPARRSKTRQ